MRTRHLLAAAAALALAGSTAGIPLTGATAAPAHLTKAKPTIATVAKNLVGPLSVAQAPDGTRYWADAFAGLLYKQAPAAPSRSSTRARTTPPTASLPTAGSSAS